jgi:hypothetical protein
VSVLEIITDLPRPLSARPFECCALSDRAIA